jgi:hypothetical protein
MQKNENLYDFVARNTFGKFEGTNYFKCDFPGKIGENPFVLPHPRTEPKEFLSFVPFRDGMIELESQVL